MYLNTFSCRDQVFNTNDNSGADVVEYNRVLTLMRDLPEDMFVDRLLLDYYQSESNLDNFRIMLFDMIRNFDDFPFEEDCELKRRVHTRQGDSVASKLARDIHVLLSVIEGEDVSRLKDMLSVSSRQTRSKSVSKVRSYSRLSISSNDRCLCSSELKHMKETISAIQADVLLMKQRQAATENMRNSEIKNIRDSVSAIETVNQNLKQMVSENSSSLQKCATDMQSDIDSSTKEHKTAYLKYSTHIKTLQDNMLEMKATIIRLQESVSKVLSNIDLNHFCDTNSTIPNIVQENKSPASFTAEKLSGTENTKTLPVQEDTYAEVVSRPNDTNTDHENDSSFGNMKIPTIISAQRKPRYNHQNYDNNAFKARDINFKIIHQEIAAKRKLQQQKYDSYAYARNAEYVDGYANSADDEDFSQYVRRRTKRFYIGGFRPSITDDKLARYINRRGPKVTKVTIFRRKQNPKGNVVIRVNIEDNENLEMMTNYPNFWPKGVICRPWLSYRAYRDSHGPRDFNYDHNAWGHYEKDADGFTDKNQYSVLGNDDVD